MATRTSKFINNYKNRTLFLFIALIFTLLFSSQSAIPTISPENSLLNVQTNYVMNYFAFKQFQTTSFFQIDFSQSDIIVPDGLINATATLNSVSANQSLIASNCTNKICMIRLGASFAINTNVQIRFGFLTNPKYTASQKINVLVYIGVNSNETQSVTISSSVYQPMPIIVNSVIQSDYGVGSQDVTYTINISFSYVPRDPQISIQIPTEVGYTYLDTQILFYGTVQNISPFLTNNIIILSLISSQIVNPNGFMLLKLKGFRNPRYIGTSSNFNVTMVQKKISTTNNCVTCRVAILYSNSSKLITVSSTTPGDIITSVFTPSSQVVSDQINLTIGIKIVAPIPDGGKFRILLPSSIVPVTPIYCESIYGFTVSNPAYCIYNSALNALQTVNFTIPYLQQTGDAIIRIGVINPKDNRQTSFNFQTLDDQNRKIGKSRQAFQYSATPFNLNGTMSKSITQLESIFTLSSTIILGRPLIKSTDSLLVILPPSQFYNLSAIVCSSSSLDLACTKSYDNYTKSLLIRFSPPCSVCNASSIISFKISNLINPSFINQQMQTLKIQTNTPNGVVQSFDQLIQLKQKVLVINSLLFEGNQQVGSSYKFKIQFQIPKYIQSYGGYLIINYNENQTYIDPILTTNSYQYPLSASVLNENNQSFANTLIYYQNSKPYSLKHIKIKLCTNDSFCGSNLTINSLRKSFYPLQESFQLIKAVTLYQQSISSLNKHTSNFVPISYTTSLSVNSTISITNTISNYVFKFNMNKIPFESGLKIDLTTQHKIQQNGRCFVEFTPSTSLGYAFDCIILNSSSFKITYLGDIVMMSLYSIDYTITVVNVLNPPTIMPLTYRISTTLAGYTNSIFTASYSVINPYSLVLSKLNSSNTTYSSAGSLLIVLSNGYYLFDELKVYLPKQNFKTFSSFNGINLSPSSNSTYSFSQNSTYFILQKIYSISNNSFTFDIINALSTGAKGKITLQMYNQGYLSSIGVYSLPTIIPVFLSNVVVSSNRFVGQLTSLQFEIKRVNSFSQQKTLRILFDDNLLSMQTQNISLYKSQSGNFDLFSYNQILSTWNSTSKNITLISLRNMRFIPSNLTLSLLSNIKVETLDQNNFVVARSNVDLTQIIPNKLKDSISYTFMRTLVQSGNNTNLIIDFSARYPQKAKLLKIQLPLNQNKLLAGTTCSVGSLVVVDCTIYFKDSSTLIIQYPLNQTKITLKNLLNMFPSGNNLTITLMTQNNQLIEVSTKSITPPIDYDPIQMSATVNSSDISSPVKIDFILKSVQNDIQVGSKLVIGLPDRVYSKILSLNSKDCQYYIMGIKYSGCQYITDLFDDGKQWIQYVYVNNLGPAIVPTGSIITLTLYLTNPWTAYTFNQKFIYSIQLNSIGQQISKGIVQLSSLYPTLNSFTPSNITNFAIYQSNKNCNSQNIITLSLQTGTILAKQTYLYIILPNALYDVFPQAGLQIVSNSSTLINIKKQITNCSTSFSTTSGLCLNSNTNISISINITNDKYLKILSQIAKISVYLFNDNNFVTSNSQLAIKNNVPRSLSDLVLGRNIVKIGQKVTSNLKFTLQSGFNLINSLKISILPLNTTIKFLYSISNSTILITSKNQTLNSTYSQTDSQILLSLSFVPQNYVVLMMEGINPSFAPNTLCQSYQVKIYDDNYIYFSNSNVTQTVQNRLLPISDGIQLSRSNSYVASAANYSISGSFSQNIIGGRIIFNQTKKLLTSSIPTFINFSLGEFINPLSSNWDISQSLSILNDTHILFSNKKMKTNPTIQSIQLPSNYLKSLEYNKQMKINTQETLTINFNNPITNITKINLKLPFFFKSLKQCRINSQNILSNDNIKITLLSQTRSFIQISIIGSTSKLEFTFITPQYQRVFLGESLTIQTQYPTKSYTQSFDVAVYGTSILTSFNMNSYRVNENNQIQLSITPINKPSILTITFPSFLNQQFDQAILSNSNNIPTSIIKFYKSNVSTGVNVQYNSKNMLYYISLNLNQTSSINTIYRIQLNNIINPTNNQQYPFVSQQSQISAVQNIFGHKSNFIQMTQLQPILIVSTSRSSSKIGVEVQIKIQIQLPTSIQTSVLNNLVSNQCVIQLPNVQVVRYQTGDCQIYINDQIQGQIKLPCSLHPTLSNAVITSCKAGNNQYSIRKGYKNMMYSAMPTLDNKPYVFIGVPFKMAESILAKTDFLTPLYTSGNLNLRKITSSSLKRLQKTKLGLNLTLENTQQVDCINIKFQTQNYLYTQSQISCKANNIDAQCWFSNQASIMVNISEINLNQLNIQISNLVNYIRQSNFTIKTLKFLGSNPSTSVSSSSDSKFVAASIGVQSAPENAFGLIDIYYSSISDITTSFESNNFNIRVINTQNYVSDQLKQIIVIFDDDKLLPSSLDKSLLKFSVQTNIQNCSLSNGNYFTTFSLKCKFFKSIKFTIFIQLYHSQFFTYILSKKNFQSYIYPQLHSNCQNQMCDQCSNDQNGVQKCFSCRQNYYQYQNGCVDNCPQGTTSYIMAMTCQSCSSNCQTCYGIYLNNCLKCQNINEASDNGFCTQKCFSGYKQSGYCIGDNQCFDQGCRTCSTTGFCYQCLPDYNGQPICKWKPALPPTFMSYFILPFIAYALISSIYFFVKKGLTVLSYQAIFSVSILQLFCWILIIPALYTKEQAILLISMIIFRIIIGIVAYQTYYKKQINSHIGVNEQQSLLQKDRQSNKSQSNRVKKDSQSNLQFQENWISKSVRFIAHINGIDTYEEFKVLFSSNLRIVHNNLYLWIATGNKILVSLFMIYVLSRGKSGDLTNIPIISILSTIAIICIRVSKSSKVQEWWNKFRNLGKN